MNKKSIHIFLFFCCLSIAFSSKANDTTLVLSSEKYLSLILQHHPLIKLTDLLIKQAKAALLSAKGAFDPEIDISFQNKTLDGNRYYQYIQPQLKTPLWYGIELKAELMDVRGNNTATELTYGNSTSLGVALPLLSGLVMNKKMAVSKWAYHGFMI